MEEKLSSEEIIAAVAAELYPRNFLRFNVLFLERQRYARISCITFPDTSVSLNGLPWKG